MMRRTWGPAARQEHRGATPRSALSIRLLVAGAAGIFVWVVALTAWLIWDARSVAFDRAAQANANIAATLDHDITHTIGVYDLSLQAVVDSLRLSGVDALTPAMRNEFLFDRAATAPYLGAIKVLDETGRVTIDSRNLSPPAENFAGRQFFRSQRDRSHRGLYVGRPMKSPNGSWSMALSRRLEHPDGSFAGVVVGTLKLDFFNRLFSLIDAGAGGSVTLLRDDGTLIDRVPYDEKVVGREFRDSAIFGHYPVHKTGTFIGRSGIDQVPRIFAYRQIGDLPLLLTVGTAREAVLAPWRQKAIGITIAVGLLALLAAVLGTTLVGELRRRDEAERAARENERQYRFLAEHSFDMIKRFDPATQRATYVSPACRRLYGYEPEELLTMTAEDIIHPDHIGQLREARAQLERQPQQIPTLYRGRRKDGRYVWVEASMTRATDPDTGKSEIISVVRDASERIRSEAALFQAKEEAEQANRSKSQFLATMSHELRTPLNAIIGFAELMQNEVMGPIGNAQYKSYVAAINESGSHLLQLISDILDLTKAEAGMLELHEDAVDAVASIRAVARVTKAAIEKASLTLELDLPSDLPAIMADGRKVRQVFFNLIGNAIKFTPAGGTIHISGHDDGASGLRFTVADSGIGIAAADLVRVLEPFVQVDTAMTRHHQGTGLGLPAVKAIMELHGGTVELSSTVGAGTEVTITFPPGRIIVPGAEAPARSAA